VSRYLVIIILPKYSSVQALVLQPTSRSETDTSFVATLPLPPAPPASQLRLLPLPFVTPLPVDTLPRHNTQSVALNPDPTDDGSSNGSLSSSSQNEADDSENSIEEYESSADGDKIREDYEISDDEDERHAMAIICGIPSAVPPTYAQVVNDPNIDPTLQPQAATIPPKETQKKKSKRKKDHGAYCR
jgi:hypothetical protein